MKKPVARRTREEVEKSIKTLREDYKAAYDEWREADRQELKTELASFSAKPQALRAG